jgi:hypothetical protein
MRNKRVGITGYDWPGHKRFLRRKIRKIKTDLEANQLPADG